MFLEALIEYRLCLCVHTQGGCVGGGGGSSGRVYVHVVKFIGGDYVHVAKFMGGLCPRIQV